MFITHKRQSGQALVLIVLAIVGMVALTGLAIDGGDAYSDRRHAQNAADTAALAAALTKVRNPSTTGTWDKWSIAHDAAMQIAATNGYTNNGTTNVVNVYHCDEAGATCVIPSSEDPKNYVQVTISSTVTTYFAPVIGIRQMNNYVQAVAKAVDPVEKPWYDGNALVALMPGCKPSGWPQDPFTIGGGSSTTVNGVSGVFVNSTCPSGAYSSSNGSTLNAASICVVPPGGIVDNGTESHPPQNCGSQYDTQTYKLPPLGSGSCTSNGTQQTVGGKLYVTPGNWAGTFPPGGGGTDVVLERGIYCLNSNTNALVINGGTVTTDADGNGNWHDTYEGVVFYIPNGGVTINGNGVVNLSAMEDVYAEAAGLKGYLIYLPPTNHSAVDITGGSNSSFQGTILAPGSPITLNGGNSSDSLNLECQIIGYSMKLTGSGTLNITYNESLNGTTWTNPLLQPYNSK